MGRAVCSRHRLDCAWHCWVPLLDGALQNRAFEPIDASRRSTIERVGMYRPGPKQGFAATEKFVFRIQEVPRNTLHVPSLKKLRILCNLQLNTLRKAGVADL